MNLESPAPWHRRSYDRFVSDALPAPCGHCTRCLDGKAPPTLPAQHSASIAPAVLAQFESLRREHPETLSDPRVAARLLCGVTSPKLIRAKLTRTPLFGSLQHVPFAEVLGRL